MGRAMADVTVTLGMARGVATFEFTTKTGQAPRVSSIGVMDTDPRRHCWLIEPGVIGGAINTKKELQEQLQSAGLSIAPGTDPIEDLSPLDPRYTIAERHLLDVVERASPPVRRLTYGVLPPGFQQILPHDGSALPLEPGHRYELFLVGRDELSWEFQAP